MSEGNQTISALFLVGAAGLVALVAYALAPAGLPDLAQTTRDRVDVAVFLPDLASWDALGRGARRASESGAVRVEDGAPDRLTLRTPGGRRLQLTWHHPAGGWELAERLRSLLKGPTLPEAIVGSSNTALTLTLAQTLAKAGPEPPPLLIFSASAIHAPDAEGGRATLLGLNPGRTFRFCLNNRRMAELVVDCVGSANPVTPTGSFVLVDPLDPFSVDLAECFEEVLHARGIRGEPTRIETRADGGFSLGAPTIEEQRLVAPIAEAASAAAAGPVWVFMALQGSAARRLIVALDRALPEDAAERVRVLSGDGLGLNSLRILATQVDFPVYSVSSGGISESEGEDPSDRGRVEAELIGALAVAVDRAEAPGGLAEVLARLDLHAGETGTLGRSLRLEDGERVGDDLGLVYELRPEPVELWGHEPGAVGWTSHRWDGASGWRVMPALSGP